MTPLTQIKEAYVEWQNLKAQTKLKRRNFAFMVKQINREHRISYTRIAETLGMTPGAVYLICKEVKNEKTVD